MILGHGDEPAKHAGPAMERERHRETGPGRPRNDLAWVSGGQRFTGPDCIGTGRHIEPVRSASVARRDDEPAVLRQALHHKIRRRRRLAGRDAEC